MLSPIFAVKGSTPAIPGWNSNMVAKSAVAVTVTNLETVSEFVISTARFSGALKDTVRGTSPVAVKLFLKLFNDEIERYNNWKWQYFDLKIETEKEVNTIAQHALKKLIVTSNEASKIKDNSKDLEVEIEECNDSIEDYKSKIKAKKDELKDAGFFSKGGIKQEILNLEKWMKDVKSDLSKAKRSLTSVSKKVKSIKEIKS